MGHLQGDRKRLDMKHKRAKWRAEASLKNHLNMDELKLRSQNLEELGTI